MIDIEPISETSEPGPLPGGWDWARLGDHTIKVGSGSTPLGGDSAYVSRGVPLIRSQNVHMNRFHLSGLVYITDSQDEQMRSTRVQTNDVLLNITGASIGRVCVVPAEICPANVNQHVCIIRLDETISPQYLALYMSLPRFQDAIIQSQTGATRQALTKALIEEFRIPLPPLAEQRRIAALLRAADDERRRRRYTQTLSDGLLGEVFVRMFGDPATNRMGWDVKPLQEMIAAFDAGINFPPVAEGEKASKWRVLKISAVTWDDFDPNESKSISADVVFDESLIVLRGDLLMSRANTTELVGAVCIVRDEPPSVILPDKIWRIRLRPDADLVSEYLLYGLRHPDVRRVIENLATGTSGSMKNISMEKALTIQLPIPPMHLQQQFFRIVAEHEQVRRQQQESARQSDHLFDTLLHQAFAGEL